jgi:hypothetical protein
MPRNSAGGYSLPSGNPVTAGTPIQSSWANTTLADIATEVTNSLDRSGRGAMTAPLKLADGSIAAPSLTFASDPNNGFYRTAPDEWSASAGGAEVLKFTVNGVTFPQTISIGGVQFDPNLWAKLTGAAFTGNVSTTSMLSATGQSTFGDVSIGGLLSATGQSNFGNASISGLLTIAYTTPPGVPVAGNVWTTATGLWGHFSGGTVRIGGNPVSWSAHVYLTGIAAATTVSTFDFEGASGHVDHNIGAALTENTGAMTAPVGGLYHVNLMGQFGGTAGTNYRVRVLKNGASFFPPVVLFHHAEAVSFGGTAINSACVSLNVQLNAGDVLAPSLVHTTNSGVLEGALIWSGHLVQQM